MGVLVLAVFERVLMVMASSLLLAGGGQCVVQVSGKMLGFGIIVGSVLE